MGDNTTTELRFFRPTGFDLIHMHVRCMHGGTAVRRILQLAYSVPACRKYRMELLSGFHMTGMRSAHQAQNTKHRSDEPPDITTVVAAEACEGKVEVWRLTNTAPPRYQSLSVCER